MRFGSHKVQGAIIGVLVGAILGAAGGFAGGLFTYPFLFAPAPVNESVGEALTRPARASGNFTQANPSDPIHWGTGSVSLYDSALDLGADFEVGPGPKYHVYLVPQVSIDPDTRVEETMFVDLGRLKSFAGAQSYDIPVGLRLQDYPSVVIWCEQFNTLISTAQLSFH